MSTQSRLQNDKQWSRLIAPVFILCILSALISYVWPDNNSQWKQWFYLCHSFTGIGVAIISFPYLYAHTLRTFGIRSLLINITGLLSGLLLLILILTGTHIIIFGQSETTRWIYDIHIYFSWGMLICIIAHILIYRLSVQSTQNARTLEGADIKKSTVLTGITIAGLVLLAGAYQGISFLIYSPSPIEPYEYPYGDTPFTPSETNKSSSRFIATNDIAGSLNCSSCHQEVFEQWKSSIHSQSASEQAYEKNIDLLSQKKGISATRYCEGCHAPIALLAGQLTPNGQHGGIPGTAANSEGVSCMSCHGITDIAHVNGNGSFNFKRNHRYLFEGMENPVLRLLTNFLIRIHPQEHRMEMSKPVLKSPQMCASCHAQFMDKEMNDFGWVKMQDEYSSWLKSAYSANAQHDFNLDTTVTCQHCHFPLIEAKDPSANSDGFVRSHFSLGANTAIPALNNDFEQVKRITKFLKSDKMRIHIDKPERAEATHSAEYINEKIRGTAEKPSYFYIGEQIKIRVLVSNIGVGHSFPGGTIDINEAWIHFRVTDANAAVLYNSGDLRENGEVDPNAYFYKSTPIDNNGQEVWKHDLFRMTGESFRRIIAAGETDTVEYIFAIPAWANTPVNITATLKYRKLNQRYTNWVLGTDDIRLPIVDVSESRLSVPVRIKPASY